MIHYYIKKIMKKKNNRKLLSVCFLLVISIALNFAMINVSRNALDTCDEALSTANDYKKLYEAEKIAHGQTKLLLENAQKNSSDKQEILVLYSQSMNVIAENSLLAYVDTDNEYAQELNLTEKQNGPVYLFSDTIIKNGYYGDYPLKPYSQLSYTDSEIELLERLVECETGGLSRDSKSFVVCTILNRMLSDEFPGSMYDVIMQEHQFTPVSTGKINRVTPSDDTVSAVKYTLASGIDTTNGALYFGNMVDIEQFNKNAFSWFNTLDYLFEYEGHTFYK